MGFLPSLGLVGLAGSEGGTGLGQLSGGVDLTAPTAAANLKLPQSFAANLGLPAALAACSPPSTTPSATQAPPTATPFSGAPANATASHLTSLTGRNVANGVAGSHFVGDNSPPQQQQQAQGSNLTQLNSNIASPNLSVDSPQNHNNNGNSQQQQQQEHVLQQQQHVFPAAFNLFPNHQQQQLLMHLQNKQLTAPKP